LLASGAHAAEFYVSPLGDDANPGTRAAPFKTVQKARETVRGLVRDMDADIVVYLEDGTHVLSVPLSLCNMDSGQNGHTVVYRAVAGAQPVLGGGVQVTSWQPDGHGRWKARATFADTRQLYVNGIRARRARGPFPGGAERYGDLTFIDGDAGYVLPGHVEMAQWRNQGDIEFGYLSSWSHMICKVKTITHEDTGVRIAMQQPNYFLAARKEGRQAEIPDYIENALEVLDEPGEWYLDKPARTLYYIPRQGEDMATAVVVAPVLETLLEVAGTLDWPVHDVRFEGITFADATWLRPNSHGHPDVQANFLIIPTNMSYRLGTVHNVHNENIRMAANVVLSRAHDVAFERCTFTRLGGAGLDILLGCHDNVVNGCHFHDVSGSAIQVGGVGRDDHHPTDPRMVVKDNRVSNCYIHHIGVEYEDSVAVFAGYTDGTVIAHNEIAHLPYTGISVGWGWGEEDAGGGAYEGVPYKYATPTPAGNNRIEYNHIHHVMRSRNDGGGVYTLSNQPGTVIRGNHIHDNTNSPGGIYLDEGSGYIEVTGNCVYNVHRAMNYNNRAQDRTETCNEHDNFFDVGPGEETFPEKAIGAAGLEAAYADLLAQR